MAGSSGELADLPDVVLHETHFGGILMFCKACVFDMFSGGFFTDSNAPRQAWFTLQFQGLLNLLLSDGQGHEVTGSVGVSVKIHRGRVV